MGGRSGGSWFRSLIVPDRVKLFGLKGKNPLEFRREQILDVVAEPSPLDEYVTLREKPRATATADFDLGVWCEEHKLADLAMGHFEDAVQRDPEFAPAHVKLGHALQGDKWLDADGIKEAQGLVKYQGHWISAEEKERREGHENASAESKSWTRRIAKMIAAYRQGPEDRSRLAEEALLDISEPAAVGPLMRTLGEDRDPAIRALAARVLGKVPGPEAAAALVSRLLAESDQTVRATTMTELARRDPAHVVPILAQALRSTRTATINRAAWALSSLNAVAVVPRLVPALVSTEFQTVMVPVPPSQPTGFYSGGGPSIAVQTPIAVGPGSVAFGARAVPINAYTGNYASIGTGGGGPSLVPRIVPFQRQNVEVLAALVKLTGRDFGYDVSTWQRWVASSFRINPAGGERRVPQP